MASAIPNPKMFIGCIGKCTSGLTLEELDDITDSIQKVMDHDRGKVIFKKYLTQAQMKDNLACVEFYDKCDGFIENDTNVGLTSASKQERLDSLATDLNTAMEIADDMDTIPEIDMALFDKYNNALQSNVREDMLAALNETKICLLQHLQSAHKGFRTYVMEPCPLKLQKQMEKK